MFGKGIQIMRVGGIRVEIDWSWLFIAALTVFSLGAGYFPTYYPLWSQTEIWLTAIVVALLFFLSVLLHELSHSLVARSRGIEVDSIRLFIFGGVSNIKREAEKPGEEFAIAVVGPMTSLILAGLFWLIGLATAPGTSLHAGASYLAVINFALAVFNLIPGFPLDGGRVFRSILWAVTHNYTRATQIAATVGRFIGYAFVALGIWLALAGGLFDGLWIGLIGWFIINAASQTYQQVMVDNLLRGLTVGQVMGQPGEGVPPELTLDQLVNQYFIYRGQQILPVIRDDYLAGIVGPQNVRQIDPRLWPQTRVEQVMTWRQNLEVAHPQDDLQTTLNRLGQQTHPQFVLPVLGEDNRLVGVITPLELMRSLQLRQQLGGFSGPSNPAEGSNPAPNWRDRDQGQGQGGGLIPG